MKIAKAVFRSHVECWHQSNGSEVGDTTQAIDGKRHRVTLEPGWVRVDGGGRVTLVPLTNVGYLVVDATQEHVVVGSDLAPDPCLRTPDQATAEYVASVAASAAAPPVAETPRERAERRHQLARIREAMIEACEREERGSVETAQQEQPGDDAHEAVHFELGQMVDPLGNPVEPTKPDPLGGTVTIVGVDREAGVLRVEPAHPAKPESISERIRRRLLEVGEPQAVGNIAEHVGGRAATVATTCRRMAARGELTRCARNGYALPEWGFATTPAPDEG